MRTTRAIQLLFMIHATVAGDTLMGHEVRLDATGKIIPWLDVPDPFAKLSELAWQYWNGAGVPFEHGHPLWYWYSSWHPGTPTGRAWPSTPASMSGWLAQVAVAQLAFSGNASAVHQMAIPFCKYVIANGTTPADASWAWGGMPYASADPGNLTFNGATSSRYGNASEHRGDGVGVIEPDKAAEAAWGFLLLANATAEASGGPLRAAAVAVGDTLAANVRAANGTHSPWPFRVYAHSGAAVEEYTSNVVQSLLVLDELQRQCRDIDCTAVVTLRCGGTLPRSQAYARAASIAMAWQRAFPEVNGKWTACCEDVPIDNSLTNYNSMQSLYAAQHLIATRADDWETRAASILEFVETHLIWIPTNDSRAGAPVQWGARTVSEQLQYPLKMGIHTARYAATVAMYNDATTGGANATLRDIAFRSYSWASYCTQASGVNLVGPSEKDVWFRIQLDGGTLQMIEALAYAPHGMPSSNHLLLPLPVGIVGGGTVPTRVAYADSSVAWTSSGVPSTDRLRITFVPKVVTAGGLPLPSQKQVAEAHAIGWYNYNATTGLLVVHHAEAADVVVSK